MHIRIRRHSPLLALALVTTTVPAAAIDAAHGRTDASAPAETTGRARVVLIGDAGNGTELADVFAELLGRQGVALEIDRRERFRPSAFLSENDGDSRVWVFVTQNGPRVAKLYFRGPFGKRFLLRKLALRSGLDELGRELIAQVVETSTLTLLRSEAGLSREEARADLSNSTEPGDPFEPEAPPAEAVPPSPSALPPGDAGSSDGPAHRRDRAFDLELGARGVVKWGGSDLGADHGIGVEAGLAWRPRGGPFVRGRLAFEYGLGQSIEGSAINADVRTTSLRGGADVGFRFGRSAFAAGAAGGLDIVRITPRGTLDASLDLARPSSATVPVVRLEARYELTLRSFRVTAGLFGDVSLMDTHYDVRLGDEQNRIAAPWMVRPGVALTLGGALPL